MFIRWSGWIDGWMERKIHNLSSLYPVSMMKRRSTQRWMELKQIHLKVPHLSCFLSHDGWIDEWMERCMDTWILYLSSLDINDNWGWTDQKVIWWMDEWMERRMTRELQVLNLSSLGLCDDGRMESWTDRKWMGKEIYGEIGTYFIIYFSERAEELDAELRSG